MVPEKLFQDKSPAERLNMLDTNADKVKNETYTKSFDEDELRKRKEALADTSVQITDYEQQIRDFKEQVDEKLKPLKEERKQLIADIKAKGELVTEKCYAFLFTEDRKIGVYNGDGELIYSRKANPDELSPTIQMGIRNQTFGKASNE